jgi:hypothetical protein
MKVNQIDLYDVFKLKDGNTIKITKGNMFDDGRIFKVSSGGIINSDGWWKSRNLSDLVDEEFEILKEYKRITLETALISIRKGKWVYTKFVSGSNGYFRCLATFNRGIINNRIIVVDDNECIERSIGMFETLDYEFYKEV